MKKPDFNSNVFLASVHNVSDTPASLNWRSKRKMKRGGSASWGQDERILSVAWEKVPGWSEVRHDGTAHFGQLHIIASVWGEWFDWNIEHLRRPGENGGTESVDAQEWADMGARTWMDVVALKRNCPNKEWRLLNGDWFGLYIASYPGGQTVRSDVLAVQFEGSDVPPPVVPPTGDAMAILVKVRDLLIRELPLDP